MAAEQSFSLACDPAKQLLRSFSSDISYRCNMGSVSSLIEKHDFSPDDFRLDFKPLPDSRSPGHFLKRGLNQKELLSYLSITKKDGKSAKKISSGLGFRREHSLDEEENDYPGLYQKERRAKDFTKTSLPERGRFEKSRFGPSSLKSSNGKNFMSMQSLCSSGGHKLSKSNGSLNTLGSLNSPSRRGPLKSSNIHHNHINHPESENEENDSLSDSRQNSVNSFNGYSPGFSAARGQISASTGHINHIGGSLDRVSRAARDMVSGDRMTLSCKSMATLSRIQCSGEPPPPYEYSQSVEDVARQLEERLHEKGVELRQLRRNLSDNDDPFTQVFEDKRRLWMEELDELKQMYVSKLQQISQQALRSQRALQLQLYKVQQEKKRLHEELNSSKTECEQLKQKQSSSPENLNPTLEESKWEISQKAGEISFLKQQLRDSQTEVTQKMGEVFTMKTQLREAKALAREKEKEASDLKARLQALEDAKDTLSPAASVGTNGNLKDGLEALDIERVKAELMLERRQNEAQMLSFENERKTWKAEKQKVLRYQKEIQASYLEMYHRNQALERHIQELRPFPVQSPSTPSIWMDAVESFETT